MSDDIKKQVQARVKKEAAKLEAAQKKKGSHSAQHSDGKITSNFIQTCSAAHEYGLGVLFAEILKKMFICILPPVSWLIWKGNSWGDDVLSEVKAGVESVVEILLTEAQKVGGQIREAHQAGNTEAAKNLQKTQNLLYRNVHLLHSKNGRNNILEFAHTNPVNRMGIKEEKLNSNDYLFGHNSGVIDTRTGESGPGRRSDYISNATDVDYLGINTPAPAFEKAVMEILDNDKRLYQYLGRLFGYCLTGLTVENVLPIFYGQGRNGKSMIIEIISHVMGPMAAPIQSEMLLDQGFRKSSSSASPDIMGLRHKRMVYACETDQGCRISTAKMKWLSGGDTMTGRFLYDKRDVTFKSTAKIILMTNHKPAVSDDDFAFWERVHLVPFPLSFVNRKPEKENERRADLHLREKLLLEGPGILAWMVRGCLEWQRIGLDPPPAIIDATKEYRRDEDLLGHFIDECCYEDPHAETSAKDLYDTFKKWWEANVSRKALSQKRFGGMFGKKFKRSKSGTCRYFGIKLLEDESEY